MSDETTQAPVLPVMAAAMLSAAVHQRHRYCAAVDDALAILDAIEAREAGR